MTEEADTNDYKLRVTVREFMEYSIKIMNKNELTNEAKGVVYKIYPSIKLRILTGMLESIDSSVIRSYYRSALIDNNSTCVKNHDYQLFATQCIYMLSSPSDRELFINEWTMIILNNNPYMHLAWQYIDTILSLL